MTLTDYYTRQAQIAGQHRQLPLQSMMESLNAVAPGNPSSEYDLACCHARDHPTSGLPGKFYAVTARCTKTSCCTISKWQWSGGAGRLRPRR
jgi:hypothetical protein